MARAPSFSSKFLVAGIFWIICELVTLFVYVYTRALRGVGVDICRYLNGVLGDLYHGPLIPAWIQPLSLCVTKGDVKYHAT